MCSAHLIGSFTRYFSGAAILLVCLLVQEAPVLRELGYIHPKAYVKCWHHREIVMVKIFIYKSLLDSKLPVHASMT